MTQHIDSKLANSDVRYHFEYLWKILNFNSDNINMLYAFAPILFPCIPLIAETVDRKWFRLYVTKYYFLINNEAFEGFLPKKNS
jgi:hypothetical protein